MGCPNNCGNSFDWGLQRPNRAIRGGFSIASIPESLSSPALQQTWENRRQYQPKTPDEAVSEMKRFLTLNGRRLTDPDVQAIREHAKIQYVTADPGRFSMKLNKVQKKEADAGPNLPWASAYWKTANTALAVNSENPEEIVESLLHTAMVMIEGPDGCPKCAEHFRALLEAVKPGEVVKTSDDARIYWWALHNATRENKPEVPYLTIARAWKWPELKPDRVTEAITRMGLSALK